MNIAQTNKEGLMNRTFKGDLERELTDLEFAQEFGAVAAKNDFALTLARARRIASCTQTDLARRLEISQSYIAKLEAGDANPTIGRIGKILATLGLRLSTRAVSLVSNLQANIESRKFGEADVLSYRWASENSEVDVFSPKNTVRDFTLVKV